MSLPRVIAHVDLDAFYASVEVRDRPELRGRPVIVGGSVNRGVVCAASYEARRYGVHSAMPMSRALRACPQAVVLPVRIGYYAEESAKFFDILSRYSPLVEGLSLDEAFLDLTGTERLWGPPAEAIRRLREDVAKELSLPASAGIAPVKFAAKIATDLAKPNGQLEVSRDELVAFLDPLPVSRLFGVGKRREEALTSISVRTVGDLRRAPLSLLRRAVGDEALHLQALARGEDERPVVPDREAKSIGAEETFEDDLEDLEDIESHLLEQCERVAWRLRRTKVAAGGVMLKYRLRDFRLVTRQTTLAEPTDDGLVLFESVRRLLAANPPGQPIRLCGVSAHSLQLPPPPGLFDEERDRRDKLNAAIDAVRARYGEGAVRRARVLMGTGRRGR